MVRRARRGVPCPWRGRAATHTYLGARRCAAQGVESGERETAPSKTETAAAGLRREAERVKAGPDQALASSSSRRAWKARLPILRAMVSLATVVSRRSRVAR